MSLCDCFQVCLCVIYWQKIDQAGPHNTDSNSLYKFLNMSIQFFLLSKASVTTTQSLNMRRFLCTHADIYIVDFFTVPVKYCHLIWLDIHVRIRDLTLFAAISFASHPILLSEERFVIFEYHIYPQ